MKKQNMTTFNPENKTELTYRETLGPAMTIIDKKDAQQYLDRYIDYMVEHHKKDRKLAEQICKKNLAYYAGYYGDETRKIVEYLFNCSHPIYGNIENQPEEKP